MAAVIGFSGNSFNSNNNRSEGAGNSNYGKSNCLLKDEVKNDWYVYRAGDGCVVRPYPVFDAMGNQSPVVHQLDPENPYSVFSDAFAVLPLVAYAGVSGSLQFVDYCPDIQSYLPPGVAHARTPYSYLITGLREMLPERDKTTTKSGLPTPTQLLQAQRNIHYSTPALLCRAAVLQTRNSRSKSKHAVDGIFFKGVFYVSTKSALESTLQLFQTPKDPRTPWSTTNNQLQDLFELDGIALSYRKTGPENQAPVSCTVSYDPAYAPAATKAFGLTTPQEYQAKLRELFGPNQALSDIIRILTVAEMVSILKENFPISWVYYGLKDSPYASLLTPQDRETALNDPEMAVWFGVADHTQSAPMTPTMQQIASAPQHSPLPANPSTYGQPTYPAASPGYQQPQPTYAQPVAAPYPAAPAQEPEWNPSNPTPAMGMPMGATPPPPTQQPVSDRLAYWQNKYGAGSAAATTEPDGIRM